MKKTLVTGGAGFIGSNFVEALFDSTDDEIRVLDVFTYAASPENIPTWIIESPRFGLVRGDIRNPAAVRPLVDWADRVVHFAAESHVTRSLGADTLFFETDVMGSLVIAQAAVEYGVERLIHISTSEVYGTAETSPMSEDHPLNPCTPYAAAKAGADRLMYAYYQCHDLPLVLLRPFNNYGPKQHIEKVIPRFITSALMNQPLKVHGNGSMTRDWLYVADTCRAVLAALEAPGVLGQTINLGTGVDIPVISIAHAILDVLDKPFSLIEHIEARPGQVDRHISATQKAKMLLGWERRFMLEDGLCDTIEWYKNNSKWWRDLSCGEIALDDPRKKVGVW